MVIFFFYKPDKASQKKLLPSGKTDEDSEQRRERQRGRARSSEEKFSVAVLIGVLETISEKEIFTELQTQDIPVIRVHRMMRDGRNLPLVVGHLQKNNPKIFGHLEGFPIRVHKHHRRKTM